MTASKTMKDYTDHVVKNCDGDNTVTLVRKRTVYEEKVVSRKEYEELNKKLNEYGNEFYASDIEGFESIGFDDFEPTALFSLTFVSPAGESIQYLMTYTGATINFGIATHPQTDFGGHELGDWIYRLSIKCKDHFKNLNFRFANCWDSYGTNMRRWLPWFLDSIDLIDNSKISIEIANYEMAQLLKRSLPGADVRFNLVYFKRMVRQNMEVSPKETFSV